jgi:hypothetical protein
MLSLPLTKLRLLFRSCDEGPLFREPREAQAFATAVASTREEWAAMPGEEIKPAQRPGDPNTGGRPHPSA